jgi:hypothetical protein
MLNPYNRYYNCPPSWPYRKARKWLLSMLAEGLLHASTGNKIFHASCILLGRHRHLGDYYLDKRQRDHDYSIFIRYYNILWIDLNIPPGSIRYCYRFVNSCDLRKSMLT